jgi:hypothetical protein
MSALLREILREVSGHVDPDKAKDLHDIERCRLTPTLLAAWNVYRRMVYGPGPLAPAQETECRRAFYAGMSEMFKAITQLPDDEHVAFQIMDRIKDELRHVPSLEFPEHIAAPDLFMGRGN